MTDPLVGKTILVVEDETLIAWYISDALKDFGAEVPATADTGELAIYLAETLKLDLILMDVRLNGKMDGITAASEIQASIDIPIVFVSSLIDLSRFKNNALPDRCFTISKPVLDVELVAICRKALST